MTGGAERLSWVGHATVVLELGGARAITDPVLRPHILHLRRQGRAPAPDVGSRLDAVLLSHLHLDHLDARSLRRIDPDVRVLAPRGAGRVLRRLGRAAVTELAPGETTEVAGMSVTAVPATHDGRRHPLAPAADAIGFIATGARRVYFAGDTDLFPEMEGLAGDLDVALLPVWGWGPTIGPGHLDPRRAAEAAALLRPRIAVPVHWGTFFPAGLALWRRAALVEPGRAFARHTAELAPGVEVRVLAPGESIAL